MTSASLYDCLREFSLEKYFAIFASRGVLDARSLLSLTLQDYPAFGVTSMNDREQLFNLIQNIKGLEEESDPSRQTQGRRAKLHGLSGGSGAGETTLRTSTGKTQLPTIKVD